MVAVHPRGMVTVHRTLRGKTNHVLYKGTQNPPDLTLTVLEERTVYALSMGTQSQAMQLQKRLPIPVPLIGTQ